MARVEHSKESRSSQLREASTHNDIPARSHYRPPKRVITAPQPSIKRHAIRLLIATAIAVLLMLSLLMLAVQYEKRDWNQKIQRTWAASVAKPSPVVEEPQPEVIETPKGWTFELPPTATPRLIRRLNADRFVSNWWLILARSIADQPYPEIQVTCLRMAMAISGENAEIKNDLGAFYLQQRRIWEASSQFWGANQLQPGFAPSRFNLALTAIADRNPNQAIQWLGNYLGQRPTDTTAIRLQATLLTQLSRPADALNMLEKFLKNQPSDNPLFLEAAVLAARLDQKRNALRYLEISMNGNPLPNVIRTYQSVAFREIRLSGEGEALAKHLANKARVAYSAPVPTEDITPLRATTTEAKIR